MVVSHCNYLEKHKYALLQILFVGHSYKLPNIYEHYGVTYHSHRPIHRPII